MTFIETPAFNNNSLGFKTVKVTFLLQFLYQSKPQEMLSGQQCLKRNQNIFTTRLGKLDKTEISF